MSKGGGTSTTNSEPWSGVQPYLTRGYQFANDTLANPPNYYPGQTFSNPQAQTLQGFQNQGNFLSGVFGQNVATDPSLPQSPNNSALLSGGGFGTMYPNRDLYQQAGAPGYQSAVQSQQAYPYTTQNPYASSGGSFGSAYEAARPGVLAQGDAQRDPQTQWLQNQLTTYGGVQQPDGSVAPLTAAQQQQLNTASGQVGGQPMSFNAGAGQGTTTAPNYSSYASLLNNLVGGNSTVSQLGGAIAPLSLGNAYSQFGGMGINPAIRDWSQGLQDPQTVSAPSLTGAYQGVSAPTLSGSMQNVSAPSINPGAFTPGLDPMARFALGQQASGQADFTGLQSAVDAATRPMMNNFTNTVLPQLTQRANLLNNNTGAIKDLNRIVPELERNIGDIGAQMAWQEMQRAKAAQGTAGQALGSLGMQGAGLGLQGGTAQANLGMQAGLANQSTLADLSKYGAGLGMQAGIANQSTLADLSKYGANLGLQSQLANQSAGLQAQGQRAQYGLASDTATQSALNTYRDQVLQLLGQSGNLAQSGVQNSLSAAGQIPTAINTGMLPGQLQQQLGQYLQPFAQAGVTDDVNRFNYYQNLPMQMGSWYSGMLSGAGGLGGSSNTSQTQGAGQTAANIGQTALLAYMAYLASDRRLKTNIRKVGVTPGGHNWYSFDYLWGTPSQGVMADEVIDTGAVRDFGGVLYVDYSRIT